MAATITVQSHGAPVGAPVVGQIVPDSTAAVNVSLGFKPSRVKMWCDIDSDVTKIWDWVVGDTDTMVLTTASVKAAQALSHTSIISQYDGDSDDAQGFTVAANKLAATESWNFIAYP